MKLYSGNNDPYLAYAVCGYYCCPFLTRTLKGHCVISRFRQLRKDQGENSYFKGIISIGLIAVWRAIAITLLTEWVILIFFGEVFLASVHVLVISICAVIFFCVEVISYQMFFTDGRQVLQFYRGNIALIINAALDYLHLSMVRLEQQ